MMRPRAEIGETALKQVEALGFAAGDVRQIVTTHLDPDHSGGLPDFPAAEVHIFEPRARRRDDPSLRDRPRYLAAHWKHNPQLGRARRRGRRVVRLRERPRSCPTSTPRCCWSRWSGTPRATPGSRSGPATAGCCTAATPTSTTTRSPRRPACPPGLRFFQRLNAADGERRRATRSACASWSRGHGEEVRLLCSHDPHELDLAQAAGRAAAA